MLDCALVDPEPISGGDVQYIHSVTLATRRSTGPRPVLIQVDPRYTFHKAERGRPSIARCRGRPGTPATSRPLNPIAATVTSVDTDLPRIRFVMDPEMPVVRGTRRIR